MIFLSEFSDVFFKSLLDILLPKTLLTDLYIFLRHRPFKETILIYELSLHIFNLLMPFLFPSNEVT